ncbi:MAG: TrkA-N:Sodium/hydrogen exchanger, partial [Myxococcaceae bacterium]|nr:TrkA-N:Sodium/hydrogen exchanger [Myxococcaceae bacterium]
RAASDALPMRDAFAVLFFVSMGMLFDPAHLMDNGWLTLATVGLVLFVKPLTAFLTLIALKHSRRSALLIGLSLGQIGEFSFIVTALGRQLELLPAAASQVLVVASLVSITLNPLLFRLLEPISRRLGSGRGAARCSRASPSCTSPSSSVRPAPTWSSRRRPRSRWRWQSACS